ncbi:MAG TPA: FtsQ-type POTRA domain-containing protein [Pilimelia sp.]|nr:FtsQ-type POTRA domain-containing protein [Pilimelia sp.]
MTRTGVRRWRLVRAGTDAVPPSVRRFMRRARQRRLRAAAPWVAAAAVLAVVGLGAWLVYGTAVFGVAQVRVTGTQLLPAERVVAAAAIAPRTPLARVDLAAARARVAALPPVAEVRVERQWPGTILVAVRERTAVAAVPRGREFLLLDDAGVAYHPMPARPAHLPLVRLAAPGPDDPQTRSALRVLAALSGELREQLTALVVEGPARIRLELRRGRQVIWGDATENAAKARVATALLARKGRVIDVSAPDVVTVR